MSTSIMIHDVTSVTSDHTPHYSNNNAVTLRVKAQGYYTAQYDITLFGLSTEDAQRLTRALSITRGGMTEEEIRADERRKIADKLGL
jgi:hypothetical protein